MKTHWMHSQNYIVSCGTVRKLCTSWPICILDIAFSHLLELVFLNINKIYSWLTRWTR
jgi:hypothetical protein